MNRTHDNPFHAAASRRLLDRHYRGGQHQPSSTETDIRVIAARVFGDEDQRLADFETARIEAATQSTPAF